MNSWIFAPARQRQPHLKQVFALLMAYRTTTAGFGSFFTAANNAHEVPSEEKEFAGRSAAERMKRLLEGFYKDKGLHNKEA